MPIPHSTDTLTFGGDIKPDQVADLLKAHGIDRTLTVRAVGDRLAVTVPGTDVTALPAAITAGGVDCRLDQVYFSGVYELAGKASPHAFKPAEVEQVSPPQVPWERPPAGTRRPVVALLDCRVDSDHEWLPRNPADDPFVIDAERLDHGAWDPQKTELDADDEQAGHGTFIAGLIRQRSPYAQVLSIRVMGGNGLVNETTVINALEWLLEYQQHNPVDVVVMAFGRFPGAQNDQALLAELKSKVTAVRNAGMRVVASAGNDHDKDGIVFPGAFEDVTAVGTGQGRYHASFSNYGPWVDQFEDGIDLLSILPSDRWGTWSGTSFSVAVAAAELAQPQHVDG